MSACRSGNGEKLGERVVPLGQTAPKGGGRRMVGQPYKVAGRWYRPADVNSYEEVGVASWYGELFHGRRTANGEIYDVGRLSGAHRTLPLPSYVRVTNLNNQRTIIVRVNDRGPFAHNRVIDLSKRAADALAFRPQGVARVKLTYVGPAPISGDDSYERQFLAGQASGARYASNAPKPAADPAAVASLPRAAPPPPGPDAYPATAAAPAGPPLRWQVSAPGIQAPAAQAATPHYLAPPQKAEAASGGYSILAGSFSVEANAAQARQRLGALGGVTVTPVQVNGATFYRVKVGPFGDKQTADAALAQAASAGYAGARVVAE